LSAFGLAGDKLAMIDQIVRTVGVLVMCGSCVPTALPIFLPSLSTTNRVSLGGRIVLKRECDECGLCRVVSYQWQLGPHAIRGATNSALILRGIQTNQAGAYYVNVSDDEGSAIGPARTILIGPGFTKITGDPLLLAVALRRSHGAISIMTDGVNLPQPTFSRHPV
jgi:hypothetical protein